MKHFFLLLFSIIPFCNASDISVGFTGRKSGHFNTLEQDKETDDRFCVIDIKNQIFWGYELWPLVLDPLNLAFKEVNIDGNILIGHDEELRIACTGYDNTITELGSSDVKVKCEDGEIFKYGRWIGSFYSLGCSWVNCLN